MPESPAETLRRAAEKMRGYASDATEGPWSTGRSGLSVWVESASGDLFVADVGDQGNEFAEADGAFIAAVHPGVALLIADQWDAVADLAAISLKHWESGVLTHVSQPTAIETTAIAAARAFLGEEADADA